MHHAIDTIHHAWPVVRCLLTCMLVLAYFPRGFMRSYVALRRNAVLNIVPRLQMNIHPLSSDASSC